MNERQILQNEFGIYYIADKNGNVQYENNIILASENKELLEKYLRELK